MANQFLALSLFIMLLSFFIILNSLSDFNDQKAKTVQYSLTMAFSSNDAELGLDPSVVDSVDESFKEGDALEKVEGLFSAQISGVKIQKNRFGNLMKTTVSVDAFWEALQSAVVTGQGLEGGFGSLLLSFLDVQGTSPYTMDLVVHVSSFGAAASEAEKLKNAQQIAQAARITQYLEYLGMPSNLISAGATKGELGMVDIYIKAHDDSPLGLQLQQRPLEVSYDQR